MKQNAVYALLALLVVGVITIGAVSAFGGFDMPKFREAVEASDYQAYLEAFESRTPMTEEEFNTQVEMFQNRAEPAAEQMAAMQEEKERIQAAMDEGYDTWKEAVADTPFGEK